MKHKNILFIDSLGFNGTSKTVDIMRDGVYTYLDSELGGTTDNPVTIYRPKEEVIKAFKRFKGMGKIPVIFEHPEEDLDLKDPESFKQGYAHSPELVTEGPYTIIRCKVTLQDKALQAYNDGVKEVSCGWSGDFDVSKESKIYDYIQTFSDFNHVALVPQGRCGSVCSIRDKKGGRAMVKKLRLKKRVTDGANPQEDVTKQFDALKGTIEDGMAEEHKEAALSALAGLEKFITAEAKESDSLEDEDVDAEDIDDADEDVADEGEELLEDADLEADALLEDEDAEEDDEDLEDSDPENKDLETKVKDAKAKLKKVIVKRIADVKASTMRTVVSRFHDILPHIASGIIPMSLIKDNATPCDIKREFLKLQGHTKVSDEKLDATFKKAVGGFTAEGWKDEKGLPKDAQTILDNAAKEISAIGVTQNK